MNKSKNKKTRKIDKIDTIVGVIAVVVTLLSAAAFVYFSGNKVGGKIVFDGDVRRGKETVFTFDTNKLQQGDQVSWFVNGECVQKTAFDGQKCTFCYTPQKVGNAVVSVSNGKYSQTRVISVQKPLLTLTAKNVVVQYGDDMPELQFDADGLLDGDTLASMQFAPHCRTNCKTDQVGKGDVFFEECETKNLPYEVSFVTGKITVAPREIFVAKVVKTYDQTNVVENPELCLEGVLDGDIVSATAEKLYFSDKNVGTKTIEFVKLMLHGKDKQKYALSSRSEGEIVPIGVVVDGMKVLDKRFDGTTRAQVAKSGKLEGVLDGDSVAIGTLDVSFEDAEIGEKNVTVREISLVGLDKDNYFVEEVVAEKAKIY